MVKKKTGSNVNLMAQKTSEDRQLAVELAAANAKQAAELAQSAAQKASELAQVATAVSVNIQYIQEDIREMKQSIKEMAGGFVSRAEFEIVKNSYVSADKFEPIRWGFYTIGAAVIGLLVKVLVFP